MLRLLAIVLGALLAGLAATAPGAAPASKAAAWPHPAGLYGREAIEQARRRMKKDPQARQCILSMKYSVGSFMNMDMNRLRELLPKRRAQVYHVFLCPACKVMLRYDPLNNTEFTCPNCSRKYLAADHPDFLDGWNCQFQVFTLPNQLLNMGLLYQATGEAAYGARAREIMLAEAPLISAILAKDPLLTYHAEGDCMVLFYTAMAYELVRDHPAMTAADRKTIEEGILRPLLPAIHGKSPIFEIDHIGVFTFQAVLAQAAVALEDRDLLDFAFGAGDYSPARQPSHRSLPYTLHHHFLHDGGNWGLNSGYQLAPAMSICWSLWIGRSLSHEAPALFPPAVYDLTNPVHPAWTTVQKILLWHLHLCPPDFYMSEIGDSMAPGESMLGYSPVAQVAYRFYDIPEVAWIKDPDGSAPTSRTLTMQDLFLGPEKFEKKPLHWPSSNLGGGFTALRQEVGGSWAYATLNYLKPGSMHQHADRLSILTWLRGSFCAIEKAVPYSLPPLRSFGSSSLSHNTVSLDGESFLAGSRLQGEQIPRQRYFFEAPEFHHVSAAADHIYPQSTLYRRSVSLCGEMIIDVFRVNGGRRHDWVLNAAGTQWQCSLPLAPAADFQPATMLTGGKEGVEATSAAIPFATIWTIAEAGKPAVPYRVTLLPQGETYGVFHLRTYPITGKLGKDAQFCHTLVVREQAPKSVFVAVHEMVTTGPQERKLTRLKTDGTGTVALRIAQGPRRHYYLNTEGDGTMAAEGFSLTGDTAFVTLGADGEFESLSLIGARRAAGEKRFMVEADRPVCLHLAPDPETRNGWRLTLTSDVAYQTEGRLTIYGPVPPVRLTLRLPGSDNAKAQVSGDLMLAGQEGPTLTLMMDIAQLGPVRCAVRF